MNILVWNMCALPCVKRLYSFETCYAPSNTYFLAFPSMLRLGGAALMLGAMRGYTSLSKIPQFPLNPSQLRL